MGLLTTSLQQGVLRRVHNIRGMVKLPVDLESCSYASSVGISQHERLKGQVLRTSLLGSAFLDFGGRILLPGLSVAVGIDPLRGAQHS